MTVKSVGRLVPSRVAVAVRVWRAAALFNRLGRCLEGYVVLDGVSEPVSITGAVKLLHKV